MDYGDDRINERANSVLKIARSSRPANQSNLSLSDDGEFCFITAVNSDGVEVQIHIEDIALRSLRDFAILACQQRGIN